MRRRAKSGECQKCGLWRLALQRDHITPRRICKALGWSTIRVDAPENIQWLCANCHEDKTRAEGSYETGRNRVVSESTREKLAARQRGRKHDPETLLLMRKPHRSPPPRTPEHRAKLAAANCGRVWSLVSRAKASASKRGQPWSLNRRVSEFIRQQERGDKFCLTM